MASPLEIDIALWYYCRPGDWRPHNGDNNEDAPAVKEVFCKFVELGLLRRNNCGVFSNYVGTKALHVYVEALCNVPWPVQQWVIPER